MLIKASFLVVTAAFLLETASAKPKFGAENVCNTTIHQKRERRIEEPVEVSLPYRSFCGVMPCEKTRKEFRTNIKYQTYYEEIQVPACCPGYAENPSQECAPICLDSCRHGKCVEPNVCKCHPQPTDKSPGYIGHTCGQFTCLNNNRWGANCDFECDCPSLTSYCHAETGKCFCKTGWRGQDCGEPCKANDDDCPDSPLLPVVDPEVNAIPSARFERLESISARGLNLETDPSIEATNRSSNNSSFVMANMGLNLLLAASTFFLILSVFWYRKRLNEVQNEIYYAPSSTSSSSGSNSSRSSNFTTNSTSMAASQSYQKARPPMPLPGAVEFFRKTLSLGTFYEHSDHLKTNQNNANAAIDQQASYLLNPKLESHLIASQKKAQPNIYSEAQVPRQPIMTPESHVGLNDRQAFIPISHINQASNVHLLSVNTSEGAPRLPSDDHYQVPKSPSPFKQQNDESVLSDDYSSSLNLTGETNIYEEIKPRLPARPNDRDTN